MNVLGLDVSYYDMMNNVVALCLLAFLLFIMHNNDKGGYS
jgi:hypothetical protein